MLVSLGRATECKRHDDHGPSQLDEAAYDEASDGVPFSIVVD
jgi:hypothetical protein